MSTKVRALFSIALVDHIARCLGRTGRLSTTIGNNQAGGSALLFSFFSNNRGETLRLIPYSYFTRLVLGSKEEFIVVFQYCVAICQQIWKTQQWPQDWKRSLFIPIPKKGNAKESLNYHIIALISHSSKKRIIFSKLSFKSM